MALSWRRARLDDAALLWRWANDAETRRNAFDPAPIPYESHVGWLERRLASEATRLLIFSDEAGPVGQVRFDLADGVAEIDIAIAPERRGQRSDEQPVVTPGHRAPNRRRRITAEAVRHEPFAVQHLRHDARGGATIVNLSD